MTQHTTHDAASLGGKLDALDLTDGERSALDALLSKATEQPEVAGFQAGAPWPTDGDIWRTGSYRDRLPKVITPGFKVEIEGFTAPGDVAGMK